MTLQETRLLHAYNSWATNRVFDTMETMPEELRSRDLQSGHKNAHGTLVHLVGVEKMWLSRWHRKPDRAYLSAEEAPSLEQLRNIWKGVGFETAKFLGTMTDRKLQEPLAVTMTNGEKYSITYGQSIQHVVDHSTYHRGQLAVLLRQLGIQPPATSLSLFYRETGKLVTER